MRQLIWLRTDLRVEDNTALAAAMRAGPTIALFVVTPGQWLIHDDAPVKVDFWMRNLSELATQLALLNVPLLVRHADSWRDVPEVLAAVSREHDIAAVQANAEYGINEEKRDAAVRDRLAEIGVDWREHLDQLLFQPASILTRTGGFFQVFSQFRKVCWQHLHESLPRVQPRPQAQAPLDVPTDPVPTTVPGFDPPADAVRGLWPAGETHALQRLSRFATQRALAYDVQRDFPALQGTSGLSPYLAAGVVSPRQCLHAAIGVNEGRFDHGNDGVVTWVSELIWREFYKHVLVGFPRVSRHRAFRLETEALPWRDAPRELAAWEQGRTGFPLVDAAMRQLLETGWMHNRLRMVVAMFLTKNLLIDWRVGERFFMRHLIDGDLAANNGGWQWSASTGTDAVPWFRLFNPISQSQRFDPKGHFIRHWVPELAALDAREIHDPARLDGLFAVAGYPRPIVDLAHSRTRALDAFKGLGA